MNKPTKTTGSLSSQTSETSACRSVSEKEDEPAIRYSAPRKIILLVVLLAAWVLANADRIAMSISIIPMSKEFSLNPGQVGFVLSSFYVTYAVTNLLAGWMADKMGSKRVLVFCVASWSVFTSLTGVAGSLGSLVAIRALFGIGEGGFAPASSVTIAEAFKKSERARPKSLVIGAAFLGSAIGSGWIAAMIHHHGWRFAYHVLGAVGVLMAVVLWLVVKEAPEKNIKDKAKRVGVKQLLRNPVMRKTALIFFFSNMLMVGLMTWMPTFLVKEKHVNLMTAGFVSSLPYIFSFVCLNVVGWLLDRYGRKHEKRFLVGGAFAMVAFMTIMLACTQLWTLLLCWALCMMSYTFVYGTVFAIPLKRLPDEMIGSAAGVVNFGGQLAASISPAVIGLLVSHYGGSFVPALLFLVGAGACAFLVSVTWKGRRDAPTH
ncbi:MFS transporter [Paraburkholderia fynbosensis]|uniref:Putative sulfoacetate transporter SauU n=1 Tax=Paraburkholderia fynbosensis TaxID=1200993 RepID=A0A6J5H4Q4_9BURK|nr:MFS transporter [Paraburkholderia fynbosensis]CAB3810460.1 putative sulfoacetate transporter SauU [Paraburkholderia fynbosensis]